MAIKHFSVSNFRCFRKISVPLGGFNVLIGANASGKTNVVQLLRLLRDIATDGLEPAISQQGGTKYLRNLRLGRSANFRVEVETDQQAELWFTAENPEEKSFSNIQAKANAVRYALSLDFNRRGFGYNISEDSLSIHGELFYRRFYRDRARRRHETEPLGNGIVKYFRDKNRVRVRSEPSTFKSQNLERYDPVVIGPELSGPVIRRIPKNSTLAFNYPFYNLSDPDPVPINDFFKGIGLYDFDPKLPKRAVPITGRTELSEDGSNLALALNNVLHGAKRREFSSLLEGLLPFVEEIGVERFADKSLLFKLRETHTSREYLPASLLSDGTIGIAALILALYFENKPIVVIEEPERGIHAHLIGRVVDMMKEASRSKQIIVTTHNPFVVKHAGLENLLMCTRDADGFSSVTRPADSAQVAAFLREQIGVESLLEDDLLGA